MRSLRFLIAKDGPRLAPWLAAYYALLLLLVLLAKNSEGPSMGDLPRVGPDLGTLSYLLHLLIVGILFSRDSPSSSSSFWLTRPLSGWSILAGKEAFYFVFLAVPAMLTHGWALARLGLEPQALPGWIARGSSPFVFIMLLFALLASLTRTIPRYLLALSVCLTPAALAAREVSFASALDNDFGRVSAGDWRILLFLVLLVGSGLLLVHFYQSRHATFTTVGLALLVVLVIAAGPYGKYRDARWKSAFTTGFELAPFPPADAAAYASSLSTQEAETVARQYVSLWAQLSPTSGQPAKGTYYRYKSRSLDLFTPTGERVRLAIFQRPEIGFETAYSEILVPSWQPGDPALRRRRPSLELEEREPLILGASLPSYSRFAETPMLVKDEVHFSEHRLSVLGELPLEPGARLEKGATRFEVRSVRQLPREVGFTLEHRDTASRAIRCEDLLVLYDRDLATFELLETRRLFAPRTEERVPLPLPIPELFDTEAFYILRDMPAERLGRSKLVVVRDCRVSQGTATISTQDVRMAELLAPWPIADLLTKPEVGTEAAKP
ncbi:MAG: hypothetical protein KDD11_00790 [Acidobacteria bacterium]|nr:hypothetical protein [Acidobacteriota bacterium]